MAQAIKEDLQGDLVPIDHTIEVALVAGVSVVEEDMLTLVTITIVSALLTNKPHILPRKTTYRPRKTFLVVMASGACSIMPRTRQMAIVRASETSKVRLN